MEKEIEKIIREYDYCKEGAGWAAQDIDTLTKAHYFEFVTWLTTDGYFFYMGNYNNIMTFGSLRDGTNDYHRYTLDELYNYWLENYKNK
jgi:hypothetical protein